MKTLLPPCIIALLVGCSHSPSKVPENYTITETSHECSGGSCHVETRVLPEREVTVKPIQDLPRVHGQTNGTILEPVKVTIEDNEENPYEVMEREENLLNAMKHAVEHGVTCNCQPGDPLCSCIETK